MDGWLLSLFIRIYILKQHRCTTCIDIQPTILFFLHLGGPGFVNLFVLVGFQLISHHILGTLRQKRAPNMAKGQNYTFRPDTSGHQLPINNHLSSTFFINKCDYPTPSYLVKKKKLHISPTTVCSQPSSYAFKLPKGIFSERYMDDLIANWPDCELAGQLFNVMNSCFDFYPRISRGSRNAPVCAHNLFFSFRLVPFHGLPQRVTNFHLSLFSDSNFLHVFPHTILHMLVVINLSSGHTMYDLRKTSCGSLLNVVHFVFTLFLHFQFKC